MSTTELHRFREGTPRMAAIITEIARQAEAPRQIIVHAYLALMSTTGPQHVGPITLAWDGNSGETVAIYTERRQHPRAVAVQEDGQQIVRITHPSGDTARMAYDTRMDAYVAAAAFNLAQMEN